MRQETSIGVTIALPKTTALLFDRVVTPDPSELPPDVSLDIVSSGSGTAARTIEYEFNIDGAAISLSAAGTSIYDGSLPDEAFKSLNNENVRVMAEVITQLGLQAVPVYGRMEACDLEYKKGDYSVLAPVFENLQLVEEKSLEWKQVLEFRRDEKALGEYRRLIHWLDGSMVGKSISYLEHKTSGRRWRRMTTR